MARLNEQQAADLLGLKKHTVRRYWRTGGCSPAFPEPKIIAGGPTWTPTELKRWSSNRRGPGPAPGTKRQAVHPCTQCRELVKRRNVVPADKKNPEQRLCDTCYKSGDPIHGRK